MLFTGASVGQRANDVVDVRPILPRSAENAWELAEARRSEIAKLVEQRCSALGLEALVVESSPYVHPAAVRFECWKRTKDPQITARAEMSVEVHPLPYHQFETTYTVRWHRHGRQGAIDHLFLFDQPQIDRMLGFLCAEPVSEFGNREALRILRPGQLRQQWVEFWKPKNKIQPIRRDWLQGLSLTMCLAGGVLLYVGNNSTDEFALSSTPDEFQTARSVLDTAPPPPEPPPPPPPAARPMPVSDTSSNVVRADLFPTLDDFEVDSLTTSDSKLVDGRFYHSRTITTDRPGQRIVVYMRSAAFDTLVSIGKIVDGRFSQLAFNDDADDDGTNSKLELVATDPGEYLVIFTTTEPNTTGQYRFVLR